MARRLEAWRERAPTVRFPRDSVIRARRAKAPCRWQGARAASAEAQAAADPGGDASATEGGGVRPGGAHGDARWGADVAARRPLGPPGGPRRIPTRLPPGDGPAVAGVARSRAKLPPSAHLSHSRRAPTPTAMRPPRLPPREGPAAGGVARACADRSQGARWRCRTTEGQAPELPPHADPLPMGRGGEIFAAAPIRARPAPRTARISSPDSRRGHTSTPRCPCRCP